LIWFVATVTAPFGSFARRSDVKFVSDNAAPVAPAVLEENLSATNVELMGGDLAEIEHAVSAITVQGAPYPEWLEATTGR
jgi:hypothetical protein